MKKKIDLDKRLDYFYAEPLFSSLVKSLYIIKNPKAKLKFYLVKIMILNSYIGKLQNSYKDYAYLFKDLLITYISIRYI